MASRATVAAYVVVEGDPAWRIDRMASERLGLASRSRSRKLIRKGEILLNGAICESSRFVHPGDRLELLAAVEPPPVFEGDLYEAHEQPHVPHDLSEAIGLLDDSRFARDWLGADAVEHYVHFFRTEVAAFGRAVTDWERQRYFEQI